MTTHAPRAIARTPPAGAGEPPALVWRFALVLTVVLVAVRAVPSTGLIVCVVLAVHALRGARQTVEALLLLSFVLLLGYTNVTMGRWLVVFAAFGRAVWDTVILEQPLPGILRFVGLFFVTVLVLSGLASPYPLVSILKVTSFTVGVSAAAMSLHRTAHLREYWFGLMFTMGLFIIFASLPVYATGGGYRRTAAGFQGILSHPQTYGPVLTPFAILLTGLWLFEGDRRRIVLLGVLLTWANILMSGARTAFLSAVMSLAFIGVLHLLRPRARASLGLGRFATPASLILVVALAFGAFLKGDALQSGLQGFMVKDADESASVVEALQSSRVSLIMHSLDNFRAAPLTGIGFGVHSNTNYIKMKTGAMGLPASASVEKGFMPSAVLEEVGAPGALIVVLLIASLIRPVLSARRVLLVGMLMTCLVVNLGEMVFFSVGGMGFFFWMVMLFTYTYARADRGTGRASAPVWRRGQPVPWSGGGLMYYDHRS